jgi:hypothetical protein
VCVCVYVCVCVCSVAILAQAISAPESVRMVCPLREAAAMAELGAVVPISEVFKVIEAGRMPRCEKQYLRKVAVESAVKHGAAPRSEALFILEQYEEVMLEASRAVGGSCGIGRLRRLLVGGGEHVLVRRLSNIARARRAVAHPDVSFVAELRAFLGTIPAAVLEEDCSCDSSGSGEGGADTRLAGQSGDSLAKHALGLAELAIIEIGLLRAAEHGAVPLPAGPLVFRLDGALDLVTEELAVDAGHSSGKAVFMGSSKGKNCIVKPADWVKDDYKGSGMGKGRGEKEFDDDHDKVKGLATSSDTSKWCCEKFDKDVDTGPGQCRLNGPPCLSNKGMDQPSGCLTLEGGCTGF